MSTVTPGTFIPMSAPKETPAKTPAILPGPPGYVMVSLADLKQLLDATKPDSLPRICHVRYCVDGRELYSMRIKLCPYETAFAQLHGPGYRALELTLDA